MYNKDYQDGYHGRPRSVFANNSEYERGRRASPAGAIGGGVGGAMALGFLLLAAAFAVGYMLYFGLMALVGGLLLMVVMRLWKVNDIAFGDAFRASFSALVAFCVCVLVVALCTFLLVYNGIGHDVLKRTFKVGSLQVDAMLRAWSGRSMFMGDSLERAQAQVDASDWALPALALTILFLPGLMVSAVVFSRRFQPWFSGLRGYLRALVTAALVVPASLVVSNYIMTLLMLWADPYTLSRAQRWPGGLVAGLALLGFALVGGLIGAIMLYSGFRIRQGRDTRLDLGTAFSASFLGLLAYGLVVGAALLLYRQGDPMVAWLNHVAEAPSSLSAVLHGMGGWFVALPGFLAVQLPGLLFCAGVVSWRVGEPFDGVTGFLVAVALCLSVVVVLVMPAIAIVVHTVAALPTSDLLF